MKKTRVACRKCGARTPEDHLQAILNGARVHTYRGPR